MIRFFTKPLSTAAILVVSGTSHIWAQTSDHVSMDLMFRDSMVYIEARYQSVTTINHDSVFFLLNPEYALDTITSKGLKSYSVTQKKNIPLPYYLLEFDENRAAEDTLVVEFKYRINLSAQNHMRSDWIELNTDKLWFPNRGSINNLLTYTVSITGLPQSYHLITHTDAQVTSVGSNMIIDKDTPWYEVFLLAGKDMKEWKYDENITVVGSQSIADSTIQSIGTKVKNSIDVLNGYFGQPDPITDFKVVLRNTTRDQIGFQFNRRDMIITGTDFNDYANLSHEIAHYWWSKANFIEEPWMNESFANYSMYQVLKALDIDKYHKLLSANQKLCKNAIPVANASLFATDAYQAYYHKGALHLIRLEERIGAESMKRLLSSCVKKGIHTTDTFLSELENLTNSEARSFFESLLNQ